MWQSRGNEPFGCGQSTQGLREATALTEMGFLEFFVEDCITWNPFRNGSIVLSQDLLLQVPAPYFNQPYSGHCL